VADKKLPINIVIGAVDNVSLKVLAINEKLKRVTAPMKALGSSVSLLAKESGASELAKGLGEAGKQSRELMHGIADFGLKAAATIAAVSGSILEIGKSFGESGENIALTSKQLGITTDSYQELGYAAKMSGVDQEGFDQAMRKLTKNMVDTAMGTGDSVAAFEALGIQVKDSSGHIKGLDKVLPQIADKFSGIHSQALKNAISIRLFGKEGVKLNELFSHGSKGLEEWRQQAHAMGGIMTPEQVEEAEKVNQGFKSIGFTLEGIRNIVGSALAPALLELFSGLRDWISQNRGEIQKFAEQFGKDLPGYVATAIQIFKELGAAVTPVISIIKFLADVFGPVQVALAGLFFYLGGAGLIGSIFKLGMTMSKVLIPAIEVAWTLFSSLWSVLVVLVEALAALVGWPVVLGAAFVAAAVAIWKYWGPIATFFEDIWDKLKAITGIGGNINVSQNATNSQQDLADGQKNLAAFQMAEPLGAMNTVAQSQQNSSPAPVPQQSEIKVSFEGAPKGTRVETKKADPYHDLTTGVTFAGTGH
jgi:TP901 family phage tail tape measure protein